MCQEVVLPRGQFGRPAVIHVRSHSGFTRIVVKEMMVNHGYWMYFEGESSGFAYIK
jgi:hypothetical protein